mmetsp:Transcript_32210/g.86273  ORF Transcript_32210/g.86273 Transcript_32210/m.86273 type:complete len:228 (-) Transcript_32210:1200-1883(-)
MHRRLIAVHHSGCAQDTKTPQQLETFISSTWFRTGYHDADAERPARLENRGRCAQNSSVGGALDHPPVRTLQLQSLFAGRLCRAAPYHRQRGWACSTLRRLCCACHRGQLTANLFQSFHVRLVRVLRGVLQTVQQSTGVWPLLQNSSKANPRTGESARHRSDCISVATCSHAHEHRFPKLVWRSKEREDAPSCGLRRVHGDAVRHVSGSESLAAHRHFFLRSFSGNQ